MATTCFAFFSASSSTLIVLNFVFTGRGCCAISSHASDAKLLSLSLSRVAAAGAGCDLADLLRFRLVDISWCLLERRNQKFRKVQLEVVKLAGEAGWSAGLRQ
jgi:hypothetical protein